jgi:hypothetical protein
MADRNGLCAGHDFAEYAVYPAEISYGGIETDMRKARTWQVSKINKGTATVLLLCAATVFISSTQQSLAQLQITSPTEGTIVNPGQTLSVTVSSSSSTEFTNVAVVGEDPIGLSDPASSVPAQFSLAIPADIPCRPHNLTALGVTASGQSVQSESISIDIERPDLPNSVAALLSSYSFQSLGEQVPMVLTSDFSDGSILDVTESSYVTYVSSNTAVATVNRHGMVTAVGAGSATVTATYTLAGQQVQTRIPVKGPSAKADASAYGAHLRQSERRKRQRPATDHAFEYKQLTHIGNPYQCHQRFRRDGRLCLILASSSLRQLHSVYQLCADGVGIKKWRRDHF